MSPSAAYTFASRTVLTLTFRWSARARTAEGPAARGLALAERPLPGERTGGSCGAPVRGGPWSNMPFPQKGAEGQAAFTGTLTLPELSPLSPRCPPQFSDPGMSSTSGVNMEKAGGIGPMACHLLLGLIGKRSL